MLLVSKLNFKFCLIWEGRYSCYFYLNVILEMFFIMSWDLFLLVFIYGELLKFVNSKECCFIVFILFILVDFVLICRKWYMKIKVWRKIIF